MFMTDDFPGKKKRSCGEVALHSIETAAFGKTRRVSFSSSVDRSIHDYWIAEHQWKNADYAVCFFLFLQH